MEYMRLTSIQPRVNSGRRAGNEQLHKIRR